jgi:hypothetical protein
LLWGPIAIAIGFTLGIIIKLFITRKYNDRQNDKRGTEVVKDILWSHNALGVRKLDYTNISKK